MAKKTKTASAAGKLQGKKFALVGKFGYSDAQISRLEQNARLPNLATVQARFLPALKLKSEPRASERLLALAKQAQQQRTDGDLVLAFLDAMARR